jgi:hypothetical protein
MRTTLLADELKEVVAPSCHAIPEGPGIYSISILRNPGIKRDRWDPLDIPE